MAHNDPNRPEIAEIDESADTASFQRFVEQEEVQRGPVETGGAGNNRFRLLTLAIGAVVLIAIIVLLTR
jgi:hypothetical protein